MLSDEISSDCRAHEQTSLGKIALRAPRLKEEFIGSTVFVTTLFLSKFDLEIEEDVLATFNLTNRFHQITPMMSMRLQAPIQMRLCMC